MSSLWGQLSGVQYKESTKRCSKMKFKKIVKEADEGNTGSDHPRIYVGTYAKYNDGSTDGKWIDISEYNTYEEFVDACRELHADEDDPEFMVQDYENFTAKWYHEGGLPSEEEFNKINDFYMMGDEEQRAYEAYINYTDDDDIEHFQDAYQGSFSSPEEFAYDIVDQLGFDGINVDYYFDYESFGRDLTMDWHEGDPDNDDAEGEPEDPDYYYNNDGYQQEPIGTDQEVGENYVDGLGGVEQLGEQTIQNYFDYDEFGRTLLMTDYFEEDGYVFRHL
jgi:antirestriction protein